MNFSRLASTLVAKSGGIGRALGNRNYRVWTSGNAVSLIGTWVQRTAVGWLTWELTKSGAWLGFVAAAELLPSILVSPLGGAAADRMNRITQTRVCQTLLTLQAALLGLLTLEGHVTPMILVAMTFVQGTVQAFNQPARLSLVASLVRREDIAAAVALNSVLWNTSRIIGPLIAGLLILWVGAGWSFIVNALATATFLVTLAMIRLPPAPPRPKGAGMLAEIAEGFAYVFRHRAIGSLMVLLIVSAIFSRPFAELLPGFADAVFNHEADGLAMLSAAVGIGATFGGLWLSQRGRLAGQTNLAIWTTLLLAISLIAFSATDNFVIGLLSLVVAGFGMVVGGITTQSLLQTGSDPAMLGRVLSIYGLSFRAGPALGTLLMGGASEVLGLRWPVAIGAVVCIGVWFWIRRRQREIEAALEA